MKQVLLDWLQDTCSDTILDKDYNFLALLAAPGVVDPVVRGLLLAGVAAFDGDG